MSVEVYTPLVVLALIDSTSLGTLLIPLWLMVAPGRLHPGRIVLYLSTVASFYLVLGIGLLLGASVLFEALEAAEHAPAWRVVQLVVGVALIVIGLAMEPWTKAGKERRAARRAEREARVGPSLHARMRSRATDATAPARAVIGLALVGAGIEAATMLPYVAAIGLLTASEVPMVGRAVLLVGYCLVMIAPALVLLAARAALHDRIAPFLSKTEVWLSRNSREAVAWVVFLVGLYLVSESLGALGVAA